MNAAAREGLLFVFCGPAGSGKSSICQRLLERHLSVSLSVSTTTRPPRSGEIEGRDYCFVTEDEFQARVAKGFFVEHAIFSGYRYGTERPRISAALSEGRDILFDIEVEGVRQLKESFGSRVVTVFVFPPSFADLESRLRARATESEEQIKDRLETAKREVAILKAPGFSNYLIINDSLEEAVQSGEAIIRAERLCLKHREPQLS